jgi:uncharacterized protein
MVDALGAPPLTLLVVPDWHGRGRIDASPAFLNAIQARIGRGDEIALHGYLHRDDAAPPRTPAAWFRRCLLTAGEGEFAELPCDLARARIERGLRQLRAQGWRIDGFVPPAWLASAGTRLALQRGDLRWTSSHAALIALPGATRGGTQRIAAPCLTASSRSAWRRLASKTWLHASSNLAAQTPLLRVGLHPADAEHEDLLACWRDVLIHLLGRRQALTKSRALDNAACVAPARC